MNDLVIETVGPRKSFEGQPALNGLNLRVPAVSLVGCVSGHGGGIAVAYALLAWPAILVSLIFAGLVFMTAVMVAERREY